MILYFYVWFCVYIHTQIYMYVFHTTSFWPGLHFWEIAMIVMFVIRGLQGLNTVLLYKFFLKVNIGCLDSITLGPYIYHIKSATGGLDPDPWSWKRAVCSVTQTGEQKGLDFPLAQD